MRAPSTERKLRYAGISVTNQSDGTKKLQFRVSTKKNLVAIWMEVPGSAFFEFVQLPSLMNKYEAACYLRQQRNFQSPAIVRDFIRDLCSKHSGERTITTPKKRGRKPKQETDNV
jgi:hypothetical protein